MKKSATIWSFDLGIASIGEAVRDLKDDSFPHADSLLIPYEFAETKSAASRRRMWRTRTAHHARQEWLAGILRLAGFEPAARATDDQNEGRLAASGGNSEGERKARTA